MHITGLFCFPHYLFISSAGGAEYEEEASLREMRGEFSAQKGECLRELWNSRQRDSREPSILMLFERFLFLFLFFVLRKWAKNPVNLSREMLAKL